MNISFSPPDITEAEINEVVEVLRSGWITTGPRTKQFEKEISIFCDTDMAVCLNSATAALELTLRILGIGPGDEVIVPAYTYTASASVIDHVGAAIVMVDTAPGTFEMNYDHLPELITDRTKAIIPVDLGGVVCDYSKIYAAIEYHKALFCPSNAIQSAIGRIAVVADAAHAFGASQHGKMCGNIADFTCFSFHAVKNLTTAEGGAVTWREIHGIDNDKIYNDYQLLSIHGQSKDALSKMQLGSWEYDIIYPAYKCNMTDIAAALGLSQLKRYPGLLSKRQLIVNRYDTAFKALGLQVLDHTHSSCHLYLTRVPGIKESQRNEIIMHLAEHGIAANVHYKPLPMMTAYKKLGFNIADYPHSYNQYENEITLPLHTRLSDDEIIYITDIYAKIMREYRIVT